MKQKDILLIVVVVFISALISFAMTKLLISTPKNRNQLVEVVQPISANFPDANKKYFNEQSIDPTQIIKIGDSSNPQPFSNKN